ncbi:phosphotransferase [Candidatus Woesearchaeota archaeon]|nr:phosphotransferase [Candidatus Woesearchaeota archaeon]
MNQRIVEKIFLQYGLGRVKSTQKIEIGFTNKVYLINNKFILKVRENKENEEHFEKEVFFYRFFKDKIPVPEIRVYDNSKKIYNKLFTIYPKIEGDNLYSRWHLMNNSQRKKTIKQLCSILKIINRSSYEDFVKKFKLKQPMNWHNKIVGRINLSLRKIIARTVKFNSKPLDL